MNRSKRELRGITGVSCVQTVNRGAYLGWVVTGVNREYAAHYAPAGSLSSASTGVYHDISNLTGEDFSSNYGTGTDKHVIN